MERKNQSIILNSETEISRDSIEKAMQCLADNGIEEDETDTVLQAIGYILLDIELFPEEV